MGYPTKKDREKKSKVQYPNIGNMWETMIYTWNQVPMERVGKPYAGVWVSVADSESDSLFSFAIRENIYRGIVSNTVWKTGSK